jgi:DNA-binding transcriptional LysR family regulator
VHLTDAGAALLPGARQLLDSWNAFTARGHALSRAAARPRIRVGSPSLAPVTVMDHVVSALTELHPDIQVDLEFAASADLLAALRTWELDLTVALLPLDEPDLRVLPLGRYQFGVVVNDHDELARRTELTTGLSPADVS